MFGESGVSHTGKMYTYEDPFKNVADFDDDDSPEVPTDSMRK